MSEPVVPWDYSTPREGQPTRSNAPTQIGREAGRELARLTRPGLEKDRAAFPKQPGPCYDCAYVEGTEPNGCAATVMDALKAAIEGTPFFCHKGIPEQGQPKRVCSGWLAAQSEFRAKPALIAALARLGRA